MALVWPTKPGVLEGIGPIAPPVTPTGTITPGIQRFGTPAHTMFASASYINTPRPTGSSLLVDSTSAAAVAGIVSDSNLGAKPALQTIKWSGPVHTVGSDVPRVPVKLHTQPPPTYNRAQQQILVDPGVPIPANHVNQGDSDDEAFLVELDNSGAAVRAHEFWRLRPLAPTAFSFVMPDGSTWTGTVSWECSNYWQITQLPTHVGRSRNHNAGVYPNAPITSASRLDSENTNMSVLATRLPETGLILTDEDVNRGLNLSTGLLTGVAPSHLLNLSVVYPMPTTRWWPAASTDGFKAGSSVAEGMRFFLDEAAYTDSAINAMSVHPLCRLIIKFVVTFGFIVVDKAGSLEVDGEEKVHDYFNGTAPSAILNGFPWSDLKLMKQTNGDGSALTDASPYPH